MLSELERIILDPRSEDAANAPLELTGRDAGHGLYLISHRYPPAAREPRLASGPDVEGARISARTKRTTRTIPVEVWASESSEGIGLDEPIVNLVTNPSIETDAAGYTGHQATVARSTAQALRGAASLACTSTVSGAFQQVGAITPLTVTSGQTKTALVGVRSPVAGPATLRARGGSSWGDSASVTLVADQWTWFRVTFTALATEALRLVLMSNNSIAVGQIVYMDAFMVTDGAGPYEYVDGAQPGCVWDGTAHASTSRQIAKVSRATNPSFETGPGSSALVNATLNDISRSAVWAEVGEYSEHYKATATSGSAQARSYSPAYTGAGSGALVTGGTTYTVRSVVNIISAGAILPRVWIEWYTETGTYVGQSAGSAVSAGAGRKVVSETAVAPANATRGFAVFGYAAAYTLANGEVVEFYWDAVQLIAESSASDYFDGDTPGCEFDGTAHASASLRPFPDDDPGKRFLAVLNDLEDKVSKLADYGGTYKRVLPSGDALIFDILDARIVDPGPDRPFNQGRQKVDLEFVAQPLARGTEVSETAVDLSSATIPVLRSTVAEIPGTAPAKVRLEVTDLESPGVDRWTVGYALQMRNYDAAVTADLFYEAEARTPLNSASVVTGPSGIGISGAGTNNVVRQTNLGGSYAAVWSTQASGGGGAHLTHVGAYRIRAVLHRPATNTGEVSVRLEWGVGDLRSYRPNDAVVYAANDREGVRTIADLGVVRIPEIVKGAQRWEGRIVAKSTVATDDLDVDCIWLEPLDEAQGVAKAAAGALAPTAWVYADEFDQSAGNLTTKSPRVGTGTWTLLGGGATDFSVTGSGTVTRNSVNSRIERCGSAALAATDLSATFKFSAWSNVEAGVVARIIDVNNTLVAKVSNLASIPAQTLRLVITKGGVETDVAPPIIVSLAKNTYYTIRLIVDAAGRCSVYLSKQGAAQGERMLAGSDAVLATGGTHASGGVGLYDLSGATITYTDFFAATPPADAALFGGQSMEFRSDGVVREDAAGSIYVPVSDYSGDFPFAPPSGREGRTLRYLVWAARMDPDTMGVTNLDDLRAQLHVTPRYDVVPKPS